MGENLYAFPTNREFVRTITHNKHQYRLRSVFDNYGVDYGAGVRRYLAERRIKTSFPEIDAAVSADYEEETDLQSTGRHINK